MGKLLNPPEKSGGDSQLLPNQKTLTNCERNSSITNNSGNILVYVILMVSLSFSAYTFLRQTHFENRYSHLDKRISIVEDKLRLFPLAFLNSLAKTSVSPPSILSSSSSSSSSSAATIPPNASSDHTAEVDSKVPEIDLITDTIDNNDDDGDGAIDNHEQFAHILQKLSLQVSGIQRLRRDVSHLKASRRGERQASVHPTDSCACPPGNVITIAGSECVSFSIELHQNTTNTKTPTTN